MSSSWSSSSGQEVVQSPSIIIIETEQNRKYMTYKGRDKKIHTFADLPPPRSVKKISNK